MYAPQKSQIRKICQGEISFTPEECLLQGAEREGDIGNMPQVQLTTILASKIEVMFIRPRFRKIL
jgi:hypothetical protein